MHWPGQLFPSQFNHPEKPSQTHPAYYHVCNAWSESPGLPSAGPHPAWWIAWQPEQHGSAVEQLWAAAGSEAAAWLLPLQVSMLTQKVQSSHCLLSSSGTLAEPDTTSHKRLHPHCQTRVSISAVKQSNSNPISAYLLPILLRSYSQLSKGLHNQPIRHPIITHIMLQSGGGMSNVDHGICWSKHTVELAEQHGGVCRCGGWCSGGQCQKRQLYVYACSCLDRSMHLPHSKLSLEAAVSIWQPTSAHWQQAPRNECNQSPLLPAYQDVQLQMLVPQLGRLRVHVPWPQSSV